MCPLHRILSTTRQRLNFLMSFCSCKIGCFKSEQVVHNKYTSVDSVQLYFEVNSIRRAQALECFMHACSGLPSVAEQLLCVCFVCRCRRLFPIYFRLARWLQFCEMTCFVVIHRHFLIC